MTRAARGGFTLIELLMVLTIIGILAAIAVPKFRDLKRRATATQIVGDFDVIRVAAITFHADSGYFPRESASGTVPPGLRNYLPVNFTFSKDQWTLDYENWTTKRKSRFIKTGILIGVSVTTKDQALGQTAMSLMGNASAFTVGSKYTFVISGM